MTSPEILLLRDARTGEITVLDAGARSSIPVGFHGRVIGPGESFDGVPYQVWAERRGETVTLARPPVDEAEDVEPYEPGPLAVSFTVALGLEWVYELAVRLLTHEPPGLASAAVVFAAGMALAYVWFIVVTRERA